MQKNGFMGRKELMKIMKQAAARFCLNDFMKAVECTVFHIQEPDDPEAPDLQDGVLYTRSDDVLSEMLVFRDLTLFRYYDGSFSLTASFFGREDPAFSSSLGVDFRVRFSLSDLEVPEHG